MTIARSSHGEHGTLADARFARAHRAPADTRTATIALAGVGDVCVPWFSAVDRSSESPLVHDEPLEAELFELV